MLTERSVLQMKKYEKINNQVIKIREGGDREKEIEELFQLMGDDVKKAILFWTQHQHENTAISKDDIYQVARIEIYYAIQEWNPQKYKSFFTYAVFRIRTRLIHETSEDSSIRVPYSTQRKQHNKITVYSIDDKQWIEHADKLEISFVEAIIQKNDYSALYNALQKVSSKERNIIIRYYGIGCEKEPISNISNDYKCSRQNIHWLIKKTLKKLKKIMNTTYDD